MLNSFLFSLFGCVIVFAKEATLTNCDNEIQELRNEIGELRNKLEELKDMVRSQSKQGVQDENVAFDAVLSRPFNKTSQESLIVFDVVHTNIGNAYNPLTGIFKVPDDGTYLFSWTIRGFYASSIFTRLLVNGYAAASIHTDCGESRDQGFQAMTSKTIITKVNKDDEVIIEYYPASRGQVISDISGQSGFVGTRLF